MSVFVSWSGDLSLSVATALKNWLAVLMPDIEVFVSTEDIAKGQRWIAEVQTRLKGSSHGILCLTPENIGASWLNFEAGALSQSLDEARVIPFLFGVHAADVNASPIGQFQSTEYDEDDVRRMVQALGSLSEIDANRLDILFEAFWPKLKDELDGLLPDEGLGLEHRKEHVRPLNRTDRDHLLGGPRERILQATSTVWISGSTLNVAAGDTWRGFEETEARIQVILPDFADDRVVWATSINDGASEAKQRAYMRLSAEVLSSVSTRAGPIELYLLSYCPGFSFFAVDASRDVRGPGYISVELQGFEYLPSATPNFTFFERNSAHSTIYDYLVTRWDAMISAARPVNNADLM